LGALGLCSPGMEGMADAKIHTRSDMYYQVKFGSSATKGHA